MDNIKNSIDKKIVNQNHSFSSNSSDIYANDLIIKNSIEEITFKNLDIKNAINNFNYQMNNLLSKINKLKGKDNSYTEFNGMKLSNNGKFEDFADFQKINLAQLYIFNDESIIDKKWVDDDGKINKTIDELLELKNNGNLKKLQQYGLGKVKIVEVIHESDGMNAVVLQDTDGNYLIHYNCTDANQTEDIMYDIFPILNSKDAYEKIINSEVNHFIDNYNNNANDVINQHQNNVKDLPLTFKNIITHYWDYWISGSQQIQQWQVNNWVSPAAKFTANNIIDKGNIINTFKNVFEKTHSKQQASGEKIADYYYKKAQNEGTKLNISAYSLGGSLAENSYLQLLNKYGDDNGVLNDITLFNPYHNNLTKEQVQQLKNHSIEIYCNEGDIVSSVFNQDDFKGITKNIYIDYKTRINRAVKEALKSDPKQYDEVIAGKIAIFDLHSLEAANNRALNMFDESGKLKTIKYSRRNDIKPTEIPFEQLYDEILDEISRQRREQ